MDRPKLTAIMPAYNEEAAIADAVEDVRRHVLDRITHSELLVVDDGSRDATGHLLDGIAATDDRIRVIHRENGGHGPALLTGLRAATGECLFLLDSDRQIPLEAFALLWNALANGADVAFGVRRDRDDPRLRLWLTVVIRHALAVLFGVRLYDANVPFKLLRREVWEAACPLIPADTLAPSLFLGVFAARHGLRIAEVDVPHVERRTGEVSIKRWRLLKFCTRALGQLVDFRTRLKG